MTAPAHHRRGSRPSLSVIIVVYDMEREARRSLHTLSVAYQRDVSEDDYEVIVVDNGSPQPFNGGSVDEFGPNFKYYYVRDANRSPARALNAGLSIARSDYLAVMIDGARLLTPRVLHYGLLLPKMYERPLGLTHGFHIGSDFQPRTVIKGYSRDVEDRLLEQIDFPSDGYRLFEIGSPHDPADGWFRVIGESNCTFVHRDVLAEAGGFSERYTSAAGGLLNLGLQWKLCAIRRVQPVTLLGEGTFHQLHGGATSSAPIDQHDAIMDAYKREFLEIEGFPYEDWHTVPVEYVGHIPDSALSFLSKSSASVHILDRDRTIRWLHAEVAIRDETIKWLHAEVASRDRTNQWLHAEIAAREARIKTMSVPGAADTAGFINEEIRRDDH